MDATSWRRAAVKPVLEAYSGCAAVDAVMLGGSVARGDADRWSDVEVGVFWARPPTVAERVAVPAAEIRMTPGEGPPTYDHVYLGAAWPDGLLVEVAHWQTSAVEEMLDSVLGGRPDSVGLQTINAIREGREVSGARADVIAQWQARAAEYPRALSIAVIEYEAVILQAWRWQMLAERDNPLLIAREFMRLGSQVLNVLHALNGRYCGHPSAFKRLDSLEHELTIAPRDLAVRVRSVFTLPTAEGAEVLRTLIEETFDLIEVHLPEVDVDGLRMTFRSGRRPLDELPG